MEENNNGNVLPKVVAGAAVIAGGVLAAKALSDPETREKIGAGIKKVEEKGAEVVGNLLDRTADEREKVTQEFEELRANIEERLGDNKSKAGKGLKQQLADLGERLRELKDAAAEDVTRLVEEIRGEIGRMRGEYEQMDAEQATA